MPAIICGSIAIDTILTFRGSFAEHILPDQINQLNVSFFTPDMRREYGGCAGNIAYGLKLLGGEPLPMAAVGGDAGDYIDRLKEMGVDTQFVEIQENSYTALCTIVTDKRNNQITSFHPGADANLEENLIVKAKRYFQVPIGIITPHSKEAMWTRAEHFTQAEIAFIYDPGQQLPAFSGAEHRQMIAWADYIAVNDYEAALLCDKTGWTLAHMSTHVKGLVVTLADQGCDVWLDGVVTRIPGVKANQVIDPTGCGDAFRAALLFGLERDWDLARCCILGNRLGAIKIASRGGQNYKIQPNELSLT
jgi:adenosine kinase